MTDFRALPADHALKPLETRMLEMCDDMGPLKVHGGNFVAALRVFADKHPGLVVVSPATASQDEDTALCGKGLESCFESAGHDGVAGTVAT